MPNWLSLKQEKVSYNNSIIFQVCPIKSSSRYNFSMQLLLEYTGIHLTAIVFTVLKVFILYENSYIIEGIRN